MDLKHLPEGYFSVNDSWSGEKKPRRYSSHSGGIKRSRKGYKNIRCIVIISSFVGILILIAIIVCLSVLLSQKTTPSTEISCPDGFSEPDCYRNDFKGYMLWSSARAFLKDGTRYYNGIAFRMYAPRAAAVTVSVKSGYERYDLSLILKDSYWYGILGGVSTGASFFYTVTTSVITNERLSLENMELIEYLSKNYEDLIVDSSFDWDKYKYITHIDASKLILYELHVPTYYPSGKSISYYDSIVKRIEYLAYTGINTILLMPLEPQTCSLINKDKCWYQATSTYPFKLNPSYGSSKYLKELIRTAHTYNINIILDVNWSLFSEAVHLYNYDLGSSSYNDWGAYFMDLNAYPAPNQSNRFNTLSGSRVKEYLLEFVGKLYNEYGIDGLNFQNLKCFRRSGIDCNLEGTTDIESALSLLRQLTSTYNMYFIGEDQLDDTILENSGIVKITNLISRNGLGFSARFSNQLYKNVTENLLSSNIHSGNITVFVQTYSQNYENNQIVYIERPETITTKRLVDQVNFSSSTFKYKRYMLSLYFLMSTPAIPYLFMGSEYISSVPFAVSPADLDIENSGIFQNGEFTQRGSNTGFQTYLKHLIYVRNSYSDFTSSHIKILYTNTNRGIITFVQGVSQQYYIILNYGYTAYPTSRVLTIPFPGTDLSYWMLLLNTDSTAYSKSFTGAGIDVNTYKCNTTESSICANVEIGAHSILVYHQED